MATRRALVSRDGGRRAPVRGLLGLATVALSALAIVEPSAYAMRAVQTVAAAVIVICAALRAQRRERPGWGPICLGGILWLLAMAMGWYAVVEDLDSMRQTARVVFTGGAAIALIGLTRLLAAPTARRSVIQLFDALVVTSAVGVVLTAVFAPHIDLEVVRQTLWVPMLVPAVTMVAAGYSFTAAINQPERTLPRWMALGFGLGAIGDLVQMAELTRAPDEIVQRGTPLLAASAVALVAAVITPDDPARRMAVLPRGRRTVLTAFVLIALGVSLTNSFGDGWAQTITVILVLVMVVSQTIALTLALSELTAEQSAARAALDKLRTSEARLHLAIDAAPIGIVVANDSDRLILANRALGDLIGTAPESLVGRRWGDLIGDERAVAPSGGRRGNIHAVSRSDGEERLVEVNRRRYPSPDGTELWLATAIDVTDRVVAMRELEHRATHDELTNLPNRRCFTDRLRARLDSDVTGVLAVFDLDQFKFVNDTLGHSAGDRLLNEMAARVGALRERGADVARIGGDEFCVLLPNGIEDPLALVGDLFTQPFHLDGEVLHTTASIGGTTLRPAASAETLVAEADAAMYRAKSMGPGRREMYRSETGLSMARYRRTLAGLHSALDRDELEAWYQPVWDIAANEIVALESLLRWRHPERGMLGPSAFIVDAEKSGLISDIGDRVLGMSLARAARPDWERSDAALSVNVSAGQMTDPGFVRSVARHLDAEGFDPDRLWLEITESALLTDARAARRTCHELRALGVHLAIDDFGTGYGSLTYLMEFPVESIKIDRTFVAGLGSPPAGGPAPAGTDPGTRQRGRLPEEAAKAGREEAIVAALVGLTDRLGLRCVAEGIENQQQLDALVALGVNLAQGHHLGRPDPNPVLPPPRIPPPQRDPKVPLHADSEGVS